MLNHIFGEYTDDVEHRTSWTYLEMATSGPWGLGKTHGGAGVQDPQCCVIPAQYIWPRVSCSCAELINERNPKPPAGNIGVPGQLKERLESLSEVVGLGIIGLGGVI